MLLVQGEESGSSSDMTAALLHQRVGHAKGIEAVAKRKGVNLREYLGVCGSCEKRQTTHRKAGANGRRANKKVLRVVDVRELCWTGRLLEWVDPGASIVFIGEITRCLEFYSLRRKPGALSALKPTDFKLIARSGLRVKRLRSGQGEELTGGKIARNRKYVL